jgi:hypothetical protein
MKPCFSPLAKVAALVLAATTLFEGAEVWSAPTQNSEKTEKVKSEVSVDVSRDIPRSVFTVPANPKEGRNPFFPSEGTEGSKRPSPDSRAIVLKGLSGKPTERLAMINNRTFAEGEEGEVSTPSGKVKIRCVEIKTDSVVIEVGGERRELRMSDEN